MVIIASSHLFESELAREFIEENPIVLEEGLLVPALISKYDSFSSFLGDKREKSKEKDPRTVFSIFSCIFVACVYHEKQKCNRI